MDYPYAIEQQDLAGFLRGGTKRADEHLEFRTALRFLGIDAARRPDEAPGALPTG